MEGKDNNLLRFKANKKGETTMNMPIVLQNGMAWAQYRDILTELLAERKEPIKVTWHGEGVTKLPAVKTLHRLRRAFLEHEGRIARSVSHMEVIMANGLWAKWMKTFMGTSRIPHTITVVDKNHRG